MKNAVAQIAVVGAGIAAALSGSALAHAGTMPVTHPGEPTIAMTITNHTDKVQYLINDGTSPNGQWVDAPEKLLAPGASETVTAVAPQGNSLDMHVAYRVGLGGPTASYEVSNSKSDTNVANTGVTGFLAKNYWINHNFSSRHPNTNVVFDLW
ncbi:MAG: hypothetical protein U0R77_09055 [Mycolicibacterium insubricum]|jgi:hypothetical protein|nr:hypothetical protein [Mycobacterium sp.]